MEYTSVAVTPLIGSILVFLLSHMTVRFTLVYRRNNLAAGLAVVLFGASILFLGWWGFMAFASGTLIGAWRWVASIERANLQVAARTQPCVLIRSRSRSAASAH